MYRDEDVDQLREQFHQLHDRLMRQADEANKVAEWAQEHGLNNTGAAQDRNANMVAADRIVALWQRFDGKYGQWRNWSPPRPALRSVAGNTVGTQSSDQGGSGGK